MNKNDFIEFALKIEDSCRCLDNLSNYLGVEMWESKIGSAIDTSMEILAVAIHLNMDNDAVVETFYNTFWDNMKKDSENEDQKRENWSKTYDMLMEVNK